MKRHGGEAWVALHQTSHNRPAPLQDRYVRDGFGREGIRIPAEGGESGDFVRLNRQIFRNEQYTATGNALGPVVLVGFRVTGETLVFGGEGRYQRARGSIGALDHFKVGQHEKDQLLGVLGPMKSDIVTRK
jgi:hypothetical protein